MSCWAVPFLFASFLFASVFSSPVREPRWDIYVASLSAEELNARATSSPCSCFPALDFTPPSGTPTDPYSSWWCNDVDEQGFLGFSYDITGCQSSSQLLSDFQNMRSQFHSRYVRLYGACDNPGYTDEIISSAYTAGIGVYALIWFGFDGSDAWMSRRDALIGTITTNPLAPYVIRSIDVGSEPLFDAVLPAESLASEVTNLKNKVAQYGIKVAISEMQYAYTIRQNSQKVLDVIDVVHAHQLPFFDGDATTGANAWPSVSSSTSWLVQNTQNSKKVIFTQTGWPSNTNTWKANSASAVASVQSSHEYADLLDTHCESMKTLAGHGGIGWFWQIWSDASLDGWGIIDNNGNPKWNFAPRTAC